MSIAKLHRVKATRDPRVCERCQRKIFTGQPYRWFTLGFRSKYRHIRCTDSACTPRTSELESSKLSGVYSAIEEAETSINASSDPTEIASILWDAAEEIRNIAEEYHEASVNPNTGAVFNTTAEERAETLEDCANELNSLDFNGVECEEHESFNPECDECAALLDDIRQQALNALSELSF